jgi:hexokinase
MSESHLSDDMDDRDIDHSHMQDELGDEEVGFADNLPHDQHVRRTDTLDGFLDPLMPDEATLYNLARRFSQVYQHLARTSHEQFLPTPVTQLPTGKETGRYLAIDVGGTNLRVAFIELLGDAAESGNGTLNGLGKSRDTLRKARRQRVRRTLEKAWPIQEHLKMDQAEDLFAWIGDCIAEVVADSLTSEVTRGEIPTELEMGITFSFPIL